MKLLLAFRFMHELSNKEEKIDVTYGEETNLVKGVDEECIHEGTDGRVQITRLVPQHHVEVLGTLRALQAY